MRWYIIIFFIIAIALYIITEYLRIKHQNNLEIQEQFITESKLTHKEKLLKNHNVTIIFSNPSTAQKLISRQSQYLKQMNKPNITARGFKSLDELYDTYYNTAFDNITNAESDTINKIILELLSRIQTQNKPYYKYLCYWLNRINIAKAQPWLENGMPHTLETTIIMNASWFKNPNITTLIHEITHIHQRINSFEFDELYKSLGYINPSETITGIEPVIELSRNNPDALNMNWIWLDSKTNIYWWIGVVFNNITPNNLLDVKYIALKLEYDQNKFYYLKQQPTLLHNLTNFNTFFNDNPNNYHPYEMTAHLHELYLDYVLGNYMNNNSQGFKIFKNEFEKIIKTLYP